MTDDVATLHPSLQAMVLSWLKARAFAACLSFQTAIDLPAQKGYFPHPPLEWEWTPPRLNLGKTGDLGMDAGYFVHESAYLDSPCEIGAGTKIWHFCHVLPRARIGEQCILGQNVHIASDVIIGNHVKIQNNVSLYTGVVIEDDVFLGPSCVFTNVTNPRSQIVRHHLYEQTLVRRGASIGANATIVCGATIGRYAFIGAGAVVTRDVPDYALMMGVPARRVGWMSRHGYRLPVADAKGILCCPESGLRYQEMVPGELRCLDVDEEMPLPATPPDALLNHRVARRDSDGAPVGGAPSVALRTKR